jgi:hypothetical protein
MSGHLSCSEGVGLNRLARGGLGRVGEVWIEFAQRRDDRLKDVVGQGQAVRAAVDNRVRDIVFAYLAGTRAALTSSAPATCTNSKSVLYQASFTTSTVSNVPV